MYCPNCGSNIEDGSKFCHFCGAVIPGPEDTSDVNTSAPETPQPTPVQYQQAAPQQTAPQQTYTQVPQNNAPQTSEKSGGSRSGLVIAIIYIVAAVLLLYDGIRQMSFDWGLLALCSGVGMLVMGILKAVKSKERTVSIISIVCGAIMFVLAMMCASGYDWTYIGYATAVLMLASGILGMTKVSATVTSVVEIVISAILLILGFMCMNFVWGDIAFFVSIPFIVRAIVNIVNGRKQKA